MSNKLHSFAGLLFDIFSMACLVFIIALVVSIAVLAVRFSFIYVIGGQNLDSTTANGVECVVSPEQ